MRGDLGQDLPQCVGVPDLASRCEDLSVRAHVRGARPVELPKDLLLEVDAELLLDRIRRLDEARVRVADPEGSEEERGRLALVTVPARELAFANDDLRRLFAGDEREVALVDLALVQADGQV